MRQKWECKKIERKANAISEEELKERLESIWELLQIRNCQPNDLSVQTAPVSPVRAPVKYRRSA
jgi:hypothetical protein